MLLKQCRVCHVTKRLSEFWSDKRYPDGKRKVCKLCIKKATANNRSIQDVRR